MPSAAPRADPFEARWQRWCERRGFSEEHCEELKRCKGEDAWELRRWQQAWHPRTWRGRLELSQQRERGHALNRELCTCDEGVPSWLCRVARCYSFEAVGTCEADGRSYPGSCSCLCMAQAWGDEELGIQVVDHLTRRDRTHHGISHYDACHFESDRCVDAMPVPAGGWPCVEPAWSRRQRERYEARELAKRQARLEHMQKKMAMQQR